jgi:hypothetical protein
MSSADSASTTKFTPSLTVYKGFAIYKVSRDRTCSFRLSDINRLTTGSRGTSDGYSEIEVRFMDTSRQLLAFDSLEDAENAHMALLG